MDRPSRTNPLLFATALLLALLVGLPSALAQNKPKAPVEKAKPDPKGQEKPLTPDEAQSRLLQEGSVALRMGDNITAITRFREAIKIAEVNVAYLNLAKALLNAGRCQEASETLARVLTAPRSVHAPISQILKDTAAMRDDMAAQCPAGITIECRPVDMELYIDDLGPLPCDGRPMLLLPGQHTLRGQKGELRVEKSFSLGMMEQSALELAFEDQLLTVPIPPVEDPPVEEPPVEDPKDDKLAHLEEPDDKGHTVEKKPEPPQRTRKWLLGAQIGAIFNGDASIDRETFETFDEGQGQDGSGVMLELFAGYRFSRRYNLHFGPKLNLVPQYTVDTEVVDFSPTGSQVDANLFGMLTYPINKQFSLFGALELGMSFLTTDEEESVDGANFGGFGGLRYAFSDNFSLSIAIKGQAYALSNDADIFIDETSINISGSRTLLTIGATIAP